jgi:general stress protein 26
MLPERPQSRNASVQARADLRMLDAAEVSPSRHRCRHHGRDGRGTMAGMTLPELVAFLRRHRYAVQASVAAGGAPQAAVVGVAVDDDGRLYFDTLASTRKCENLRRDPRIALVVGWDEEQSAQIEGVAEEPTGDDLARCKRVYFAQFPDGPTREAWPGITYFRVRPTWVRYSDFRGAEA